VITLDRMTADEASHCRGAGGESDRSHAAGGGPCAGGDGPNLSPGGPSQARGLTIDDIDLFEVNEAFASVILSWHKVTGASLDRTNVNGGAIALGHPLGATGAAL
jgi:acetyl-CoA C-acetyltransferase